MSDSCDEAFMEILMKTYERVELFCGKQKREDKCHHSYL